jgi:hypothetical protein
LFGSWDGVVCFEEGEWDEEGVCGGVEGLFDGVFE